VEKTRIFIKKEMERIEDEMYRLIQKEKEIQERIKNDNIELIYTQNDLSNVRATFEKFEEMFNEIEVKN
jgi:hypothetical protein